MSMPPRVLTADDRQWVRQLEDWVEQLEGLLDLVKDGHTLSGAAVTEAREQYALFKKDLHAEWKRVEALEREGKLTGFGETDYIWAIRQAAAELTLPTNSVPGPDWLSAFYHARITLTHPLSSLAPDQKSGRW